MLISNLAETLADLQKKVRAKPADARERVYLFQLLALTGQWQRALNQLNVSGELDGLNLLMVQSYRSLLECEPVRAEVFSGKRLPQVVGKPDDWMAKLLVALQQGAQGHYAAAVTSREQAFDEAPTTSGTIDGTPFDWIADADSRFGPCLEIMLNGGYYWVPFSRVQQLKLDAPADLRDSIWMPVEVTWANGGQAVGFIPARYPGSEFSADDAVVLARKTDWEDVSENFSVGLGQRMFATDAGEYPLLDARLIQFNPA